VLALRHYISDENLQLMPDFQQRILVLQTLNYVSEEDRSVLIKGRVAREMNTGELRTLSNTTPSSFIFSNAFHPSFSERRTYRHRNHL
jgi:superfamily II RNA helicase